MQGLVQFFNSLLVTEEGLATGEMTKNLCYCSRSDWLTDFTSRFLSPSTNFSVCLTVSCILVFSSRLSRYEYLVVGFDIDDETREV